MSAFRKILTRTLNSGNKNVTTASSDDYTVDILEEVPLNSAVFFQEHTMLLRTLTDFGSAGEILPQTALTVLALNPFSSRLKFEYKIDGMVRVMPTTILGTIIGESGSGKDSKAQEYVSALSRAFEQILTEAEADSSHMQETVGSDQRLVNFFLHEKRRQISKKYTEQDARADCYHTWLGHQGFITSVHKTNESLRVSVGYNHNLCVYYTELKHLQTGAGASLCEDIIPLFDGSGLVYQYRQLACDTRGACMSGVFNTTQQWWEDAIRGGELAGFPQRLIICTNRVTMPDRAPEDEAEVDVADSRDRHSLAPEWVHHICSYWKKWLSSTDRFFHGHDIIEISASNRVKLNKGINQFLDIATKKYMHINDKINAIDGRFRLFFYKVAVLCEFYSDRSISTGCIYEVSDASVDVAIELCLFIIRDALATLERIAGWESDRCSMEKVFDEATVRAFFKSTFCTNPRGRQRVAGYTPMTVAELAQLLRNNRRLIVPAIKNFPMPQLRRLTVLLSACQEMGLLDKNCMLPRASIPNASSHREDRL